MREIRFYIARAQKHFFIDVDKERVHRVQVFFSYLVNLFMIILYLRYLSSMENFGGCGVLVWPPHIGQVSFLIVYASHLMHFFKSLTKRVPSYSLVKDTVPF